VVTAADPSGMADAIAGMAEQLRVGEQVGAEAGARVALPGAVVIAAMGGSAMGGELLRALVAGECPVPITRVRGFRVPHWAGPGTLVMCVSYSGETQETLACAAQARDQGADLLIVGSGGTLVELAREWRVAYAEVPDVVATGQPRAALGYLFGAMAGAFGACGLSSPGIASAAAEGVDGVEGGSARQLGERLATTVPLIYGAGPMGAVAYRWKTQLNENAKMHAFSHALPELAHNEIVGWEGTMPGRFAAVFLSDPGQPDAVRTSIEATARLIADEAALVEIVEARGDTPAARAFSLVAHGDWASYGAALRRGVDPTPVRNIDVLKQALTR
jgi:glucose/mannose-6-phosphate isomerase